MATSTARPSYIPDVPPQTIPQGSDAELLLKYMTREFQKLAGAESNRTFQMFAPLGAAPTKPSDGLVVFADGANWNPGLGEGLYSYVAGVWVPLFGFSTGAWTPYTATLVPSSGAITTQVSASAYLQIGKTVFFRISMHITAVGTATGTMTFNFPVIPLVAQVVLGRQSIVSGILLATHTQVGTVTSNIMTDATGASVSPVNNANYEFSGVYEAQ